MFELCFCEVHEGPDGQQQEGTVAYFTSFALAEDVRRQVLPVFPELDFSIRSSDGPLVDPSAKVVAESFGRNL